jgi:hypothetical protein
VLWAPAQKLAIMRAVTILSFFIRGDLKIPYKNKYELLKE